MGLRLVRVVLMGCCLLAIGALRAQAQTQDVSGNDVFKRLVRLNPNLNSYTASLHVDVSMKTFPFLSPALDGNFYFKRPDKEAVVFNTVPALAREFKKLYPRIEAPSRWLKIYTVSITGDEDGATTFRLIPRKNGRVEHLDVKVDDKTATIGSMTWTYKDGGGFITFDQRFEQVAGNYLVKSQTGHVELPSTKADVASAFSNYKLNVAIKSTVFGP